MSEEEITLLNENEAPLWRFIPITEFKRPLPPTTEVVRSSLASLRAWLRKSPLESSDEMAQEDLRSVPPYLLNRVTAVPYITQTVLALQAVLQPWLDVQEPTSRLQLVLSPPGSYVETAVLTLAQQLGWRNVGAPPVEQVLRAETGWLKQVGQVDKTPFVLPRLGQCYLRHHNGLTLVRHLLDWLEATETKGVVVCDSWAWAYLCKVLRADTMLPPAWTLAPFDGTRLHYWLPTLAKPTHKGGFVFRHVDSGDTIFSAMATNTAVDNGAEESEITIERYPLEVEVSLLLRQMAVYSRGMPQIARLLWRHCLQMSANITIDEAAQEEASKDKGYTMWVQPWSQLKLPTVPTDMGTNESFVLHTLLLHSHASADLLDALLPLSYSQLRFILSQLRKAQLAELVDGVWRVPLLSYPVVRQWLAGEGYLVDAF